MADCFFKKNYCHACHTGFPSPVLLRKFTNNSLGREKFFFLVQFNKDTVLLLNKHILSSVRLTNTPKGIFTNFKAFFCRVDEFLPAGQGTKLEKKPWKVLLYQ